MKLEELLKLEDKQDYNKAYYLYLTLLKKNTINFELWKHYFFFLWYMQDTVKGQFTVSIDISKALAIELQRGEKLFKDNSEFNFITGYTISIMPYLFGNCNVYEKKAIKLLEKASHLEPNNPIYKMILLGAQWDFGGQEKSYNEVCLKSKQIVAQKYNGKGLINNYFSTILNRYEAVLI